jgi:hypothetical protein
MEIPLTFDGGPSALKMIVTDESKECTHSEYLANCSVHAISMEGIPNSPKIPCGRQHNVSGSI